MANQQEEAEVVTFSKCDFDNGDYLCSSEDNATGEYVTLKSWKQVKAALDHTESFVAQIQKVDLELQTSTATRTANDELGRWQDKIREEVIKLSGAPDYAIDGVGSDSGDPLDLTLTEIAQGFNYLKEQQPEWTEIEYAPKDGTTLRLFSPDLIHEDFNPSGSVEGFWQDDEGWLGAVWCDEHDTWNAKTIHPTHYQPLPLPPVVADALGEETG